MAFINSGYFFGSWLLILVPEFIYQKWMIIKLCFVLILILYHLKTNIIQKELRKEIIKYSSFFMRIWNEVATLILFSIVFLVTLKNSINWIYSIISLFCFTLVILCLIKLYRIIRKKNAKKI